MVKMKENLQGKKKNKKLFSKLIVQSFQKLSNRMGSVPGIACRQIVI